MHAQNTDTRAVKIWRPLPQIHGINMHKDKRTNDMNDASEKKTKQNKIGNRYNENKLETFEPRKRTKILLLFAYAKSVCGVLTMNDTNVARKKYFSS